jgi:hypothetical protein
MGAPPVPLSYDDLPPGSDIRRERDPDGTVRITVPAGEPTTAARREIARDAVAYGTLESIPLLILGLIIFYVGIRAQGMYGSLAWAAWAFFALFCTALVALVVWVRYGKMLDALRAGRRQATVIAITSSRLLIETTGPFAIATYYYSPGQIRRVRIARSALPDDLAIGRRLDHLCIERPDGRCVALLPGRDRAELAAVARSIEQTIHQTADVRIA